MIHNYGDALTAVPLGIAFFLRSFRGERLAGLAVVFAILVSASVALYETIMRFIHTQTLTHLRVLAGAGAIGFVGNEVAPRCDSAQVIAWPARRSSPMGTTLASTGSVSLSVIASAAVVALGVRVGDPVVGLVITLVILKITWDSWRTVSTAEPGELHDHEQPHHHHDH